MTEPDPPARVAGPDDLETVTEIKALMRAPVVDAVREARRREDDAFSRLLGSAANRDALDRWNTT